MGWDLYYKDCLLTFPNLHYGQSFFLCCAARGHALAVCHLLALLVRQTCSARRNINCQKFKNLQVFPPKPLRTKSTLHHWTCGAFGMRGRCRPPLSLTSQGLRLRTPLDFSNYKLTIFLFFILLVL